MPPQPATEAKDGCDSCIGHVSIIKVVSQNNEIMTTSKKYHLKVDCKPRYGRNSQYTLDPKAWPITHGAILMIGNILSA
jgi:hypothetical protein